MHSSASSYTVFSLQETSDEAEAEAEAAKVRSRVEQAPAEVWHSGVSILECAVMQQCSMQLHCSSRLAAH